MTVRSTIRAAAAVAFAAAIAATGAAGESSNGSSAPQRFTASFLTIRGIDKPVYVVASGPVHGIGTSTQTEKNTKNGQVNDVTLHFAGGTVRFLAPEHYGVKPDPRSCTAKSYGGGTWKVTGGTGDYAGITGQGTFTVTGVAIAQRSRTGECRGDKTPRGDTVFYVTVTLVGQTALPVG